MEAFAKENGVSIVSTVPRSDDITMCEDRGMTVVEGAPDSEAAKEFLRLAKALIEGDK